MFADLFLDNGGLGNKRASQMDSCVIEAHCVTHLDIPSASDGGGRLTEAGDVMSWPCCGLGSRASAITGCFAMMVFGLEQTRAPSEKDQ